ncbi:putative DNA-3-methyladenine glycosylase [Klebsormidium nitens]|uniref:DNA-3-methyladenine glycosylase II n=1 Tax=Klebsormidium nitens TaxID=105231 RepID=A0A1Y1I3E8_KLENI|nr:putative DNA-3-methyladenine glycosylase [Klebsormidium nitens]|eukprot:GAQ82638.1 putative DNA-3-methyladenine glycosylase [Klebsormidium nitens]
MHVVKKRISSKVVIKSAKRSISVQVELKRTRVSAGSKKRRNDDSSNKVNASKDALAQPATVVSPALLPQSWYRRDSLEVAPALLGKILRKDGIELRITEVEAYREGDSACHARVGITPRTAPLFGPAGRCYVYLCYGIHSMLNVVTNEEQQGAAVLIRSAEPVKGLSQIQANRKMVSDKPILLTGPGKVAAALGLTVNWTGHPVYEPGGLEIVDGPPPTSILHGPRVGIDYAAPNDIAALWRFAAGDTPWVSQRKTLTTSQLA